MAEERIMVGTKPPDSRRRSLLIVLLIAALGACASPVDLSAVTKYASTTAQAGRSFAALSTDFAASCMRYNEATDDVIDASSPDHVVLIGNPTLAELTDAASIESIALEPGYTFVSPRSSSAEAPSAMPSPPPHESTCATADEVGEAWNKANESILDYVQALGNLADVDAIPTPSASPLAGPLEKVGVSVADVTASSAVLSSISKFYVDQASERDIRSFLAEVDSSMPGATEALEVVDNAYAIELQDEFSIVKAQYGVFARSELVAYNSERSLHGRAVIAQALLEKRAVVVSALQSINRQREASIAYGSAVKQILTTHENLYRVSKHSARLSDYARVIETTGAPLLTDLDALEKAVKKQ